MNAEEAVQAIFRAVREDDVDEMTRLLHADPHLMEATKRGCVLKHTPLVEAAALGHVRMVRLLLGAGADVTASSSSFGPLDKAADNGHEEVVSILLSSGADARGEHGIWWPLWLASLSGHLGVVRRLLQHNPAFKLDEWRSTNGSTILGWLCESGGDEGVWCDERVKVVRALLLAGADHTIARNDGQTPRQAAAEQQGHTCCVALLEWWEGELERGYVVHRARHLAEQHSLLQPTLAAAAASLASVSISAFLSPRVPLVSPVSPLPHVEVVRLSEEKGPGACAGQGKREVEEEEKEEEGPSEEERDAMLKYVIQDLHPELYIELLAGFHALRDPGA